jgi:hypothetical protein
MKKNFTISNFLVLFLLVVATAACGVKIKQPEANEKLESLGFSLIMSRAVSIQFGFDPEHLVLYYPYSLDLGTGAITYLNENGTKISEQNSQGTDLSEQARSLTINQFSELKSIIKSAQLCQNIAYGEGDIYCPISYAQPYAKVIFPDLKLELTPFELGTRGCRDNYTDLCDSNRATQLFNFLAKLKMTL